MRLRSSRVPAASLDVRATSARWAWVEYVLAQGYSSKVVALVLTGQSSQEWIDWDANFMSVPSVRPMIYGSAHRAAYHKWHAARFGVGHDVPSEAEFDAVKRQVGSSAFVDAVASANVIRYFHFRSDAKAAKLDELAQEVVKAFPGVPVGVIYGYMNEFGGDPTYGHNGLSRLLDSAAIAFINPMPSYQDRTVGGADMERQP